MTLALARAGALENAAARPFARVELCPDPALAAEAWRELEPAGSAYQRLDFVVPWARAFHAQLAVVLARDAAGKPTALLPLRIRRLGPLRIASFAGASWANYHMGLFRPGLEWRPGDVAALLRSSAQAAGVDLFAFSHQPLGWQGRDNPFASLRGRRSPNSAFASALPREHSVWFDAHFSRATQKKLRKKARKLEALGPVAHVRAVDTAEAERFLDALFAHRAARAESQGEPDLFAREEVHNLLRRLAASEALEMHALLAGDRVVATFGALRGGARLSGVVISYDGAPETAVATPGELLLIEVVRDAIARGFEAFDLGVGAGRYKNDMCEIEEVLQDAVFGVTPLGRLAGAAYLAARAAQGWIKQRPQLFRLAMRVRKAVG